MFLTLPNLYSFLFRWSIPFEAKKLAENAPGVGDSTDIWIIDEKGIKKIKNVNSFFSFL